MINKRDDCLKRILLNITDELSGKDVKYILFNKLKMSAKLVKKLKTCDDGFMLNSERITVRAVVNKGDVFEVNIPEEKSENIVPGDIPINVIYEDDDILAVNKPYDMPTHPSLHHYDNTLANAVVNYYKGSDFVFRTVNRLDRDTTGVVLIAKNQYSADLMCRQIRSREIRKTYLAICCGVPNPPTGTIEAPIRRMNDSIITRMVAKGGQYAKTDYKVLKSKDKFSLVKLIPHTGRTHQIRVHMAHIGHPLFGDFIYGTEEAGERTRLHCSSLELLHPISGKSITLAADMPDDFFIRL